MSVSRWFKFWPLGCLLFVTGCIYFWNLDTAFCSISDAEVDVVNGYYYARGGRYIQRGNPHSRNALLDIFSLFDDLGKTNGKITITLSKVGWTIDSIEPTSNSIQILYFAPMAMGTHGLNQDDLYKPPSTQWVRFSDSTSGENSSPTAAAAATTTTNMQMKCQGKKKERFNDHCLLF